MFEVTNPLPTSLGSSARSIAVENPLDPADEPRDVGVVERGEQVLFEHIRELLETEQGKCFGIDDKAMPGLIGDCHEAMKVFEGDPQETKLSRQKWVSSAGLSFIRMPEGGVYLVSHHVVGQGMSGRVKLALRIDRAEAQLSVIKIQRLIDDTELKIFEEEHRIGLQLKFFTEPHYLKRPQAGADELDKYYVVSDYHGVDLEQWLTQKPSKKDRLLAAIKLCELVSMMHEQDLAHRDLKPKNILIDPIYQHVTLCDFGFATSTKVLPTASLGTEYYLPYDLKPEPGERQDSDALLERVVDMGLKNVDVFALKRVLQLPALPVTKGKFSLLDKETYNELPESLLRMIRTCPFKEAFARRQDTALEIGVRLILFAYQLNMEVLSIDLQKCIWEAYGRPNAERVIHELVHSTSFERAPSCDGPTPSPGTGFTSPSFLDTQPSVDANDERELHRSFSPS